ncbi:hypothetical protein ACVWWO_000001, partial [Bradyrhizobium sp. F1.13.1]
GPSEKANVFHALNANASHYFAHANPLQTRRLTLFGELHICGATEIRDPLA